MPISATASLVEIAHDLLRAVLKDYPAERSTSLLAISVSHRGEHWDVQLGLPLGLEDEERRPGTKEAGREDGRRSDYGSVALKSSRSVPDEFSRTLREGL
jgi:DNA polymerase-4